jgi:hypothetical protein
MDDGLPVDKETISCLGGGGVRWFWSICILPTRTQNKKVNNSVGLNLWSIYRPVCQNTLITVWEFHIVVSEPDCTVLSTSFVQV